MSEKYHIGLDNNDNTLRKKADSDYVSFWDEQAHNLTWFSPWAVSYTHLTLPTSDLV